MQFNIAVLFLFLRKTVSSYTISIRCGFTNRIGLTITITLFTFTSQRVKIPLYYNKERILLLCFQTSLLQKSALSGSDLSAVLVAKAIRTYFPDYELIAFDKNKETLALAVQENIIDTSCSAIDDNFKGCSYIFLCAPVSYNTACLTQLKSLIDPDCILTDVGSVKTSIHEEIISLVWKKIL